MAYQRGTASMPEPVFPAVWGSSVIQGLNSQSRGVVGNLCSGLSCCWGGWEQYVRASDVLAYPQG